MPTDPATGCCWWIAPPPAYSINAHYNPYPRTRHPFMQAALVRVAAQMESDLQRAVYVPGFGIVRDPMEADPQRRLQTYAAALDEVARLRAGLSRLWELHSAPCDWHTRPGAPTCTCGTIALLSELLGTEGR